LVGCKEQAHADAGEDERYDELGVAGDGRGHQTEPHQSGGLQGKSGPDEGLAADLVGEGSDGVCLGVVLVGERA
jgi:hypothetical protein